MLYQRVGMLYQRVGMLYQRVGMLYQRLGMLRQRNESPISKIKCSKLQKNLTT